MNDKSNLPPPDAPPPDAGSAPPAPARVPSYLQALNPAQCRAVETLEGPVLVLAGAGTGKTRVLTTRLAHLLISRRASPFQVLAVTFTNKAAREMRTRVAALLGTPIEGWWLGTFHALAARILRRHPEHVGLRANFTILDTDDQLRLIKELMQAAAVDAKKWPARQVLGVIERWKDRGLLPEHLKTEDGGGIAGGRMVTLYDAYQERLRALNACDFGDLLLHGLTVFQRDAEVLAHYHRRFRYIMVDEYQDTNVAQYLWLRLLAQGHRNLCCVGDEDQSIYGWRGAEIGNILRFEADFPGAAVIRLEENYRSTGHILGAASGLIGHNQGRLGKTLWTASADGDPVLVQGHLDADEEARWVAEEIESLQRRGQALGQIAILVRAGYQTREFEDRFLTIGLPYRVIGGPRFYERLEIRDALAYLRVIAQPDDDLAFERIVNTPKRGLGTAALKTLHAVARQAAVPLTEAAGRLVETDELKPKARAALRALVQDFERWRSLSGAVAHTDLARQVLDESGYTRMWQTDKSPEAPGRLENLKELINAMSEFDGLLGFLEHVSLVMETTEAALGDMVSLMTLHSAKGLEFEVVFLPGWEEGLFPNLRALEENGIAALEEERRLAYVGLTRACRRAVICHADRRRVYGNWIDSVPSRFLDELPADHTTVTSACPFADTLSTDVSVARAGLMRGVHEARAAYVGRAGSDTRPGPAARRVPPVLEGTAYEVVPRPAPTVPFEIGARVFHRKYGYGTVHGIEAGKLDIAFDHSGDKKVMESFVVPADQAE